MTLIQGKYHNDTNAIAFVAASKLPRVGARGEDDEWWGPGACPDRAGTNPAPTSLPHPTAGIIQGKRTGVYQGKICDEQANTIPISSNIATSIVMRSRLHSNHTMSATLPTTMASIRSSRRIAICSS